MTGYATARLLAALGRSDRTHPEQRRQILRALADAVRDHAPSGWFTSVT